MQLANALSTKLVSQAENGELLRVFAGARSMLAIKLGSDERNTLLAFFDSNGRDAFHEHLPNRQKCVSFGTDWVLELETNEETRVGNNNLYEATGTLYVAGNEYAFHLRPRVDNGLADWFYAKIGGAVVDSLEDAAPIQKWRIWHSSEDRKLGREALISFESRKPEH